MSISSTDSRPQFGGWQWLRRFSVAEYHKMIQAGILLEGEKVELLDGYVVHSIPRNSPIHCGTVSLVGHELDSVLADEWGIRYHSGTTLSASKPEPDLAIVRDDRSYMTHHPGPNDIGLLIEIADLSLDRDRNEKSVIYASDGIPVYWIVNLVDMQIEVYSSPQVVSGQPAYTQRQDYRPGDDVPLVLDGVTSTIPVREMLP